MPILTLQKSLRQAGRIRIGDKGGRNGAPRKLTTFRLTSGDRAMLDQAAALYGGEVTTWDDGQWQVTTDRDALDVIVPPTEMAFSQWYETWGGGGCLKRCDGQWDMLNDQQCSCNPDERDCTPHTRLSVMLRDLPGVGTWRIDTQGFYAASELLGAVELIQQAATRGQMLPARLLLDKRTVKRIIDGKPSTRKFVVPVLDIDAHVLPAMTGRAPVNLGSGAGELESGPSFTPVPAPLDAGPSIAEQVAPPAPKAPRKNAAAPIPGSGRSRRKEPVATSPATVGEVEPSDVPLTSVAPSPTPITSAQDDAIAKQRAQTVSMWCNDAGYTTDDERHTFLNAISGGKYQSARDVTADDLGVLRAMIRKIQDGTYVIVDGVAVETKSGLVPDGEPF